MPAIPSKPKKLLDQVMDTIRLKHYSDRTGLQQIWKKTENLDILQKKSVHFTIRCSLFKAEYKSF